MERTYYSLDDIRKEINAADTYSGPYAMSDNFSGFLNKSLSKAGCAQNTDAGYEPSQSFTCFKQYIWPRFYQEAIVYVDSDENEDFVKKFSRTKVG